MLHNPGCAIRENIAHVPYLRVFFREAYTAQGPEWEAAKQAAYDDAREALEARRRAEQHQRRN